VLKLAFVTVLLSPLYAWAVPNQISIQGVLRDGGGKLQTTALTVTVDFYDTQKAGRLLFHFVTPPPVAAVNGLFTITPILSASEQASVSGASDVWLEVKINSDLPLPRQRLSSELFALSCGNAENLGGQPPSSYLTVMDAASTYLPRTSLAADSAQLGGVAANGYQRVLLPADCGAGSFIQAIAPDGKVTCGRVQAANGGNRFGGLYMRFYPGFSACTDPGQGACYNPNPITGACSCPAGFAAARADENINTNNGSTNCLWQCYQ
jgi:hypothetical protein